MIKPLSDEECQRLIAAAREAVRHSYAPYSDFHVGAAVLTTSDDIFAGANIENASYGMTNCAERTAIFAAVMKLHGNVPREGFLRAVAVTNHLDNTCTPCGACRQVIYEFGPQAIILYQNANGWQQKPITDLLPEGFRL